mmetsp:Transcript_70674/g.197454  ORF Transcript_70674/g.197454 Transcript_70674/m.197454 type:complete len:228 (+) Transcript_70674:2010-2693(+)
MVAHAPVAPGGTFRAGVTRAQFRRAFEWRVRALAWHIVTLGGALALAGAGATRICAYRTIFTLGCTLVILVASGGALGAGGASRCRDRSTGAVRACVRPRSRKSASAAFRTIDRESLAMSPAVATVAPGGLRQELGMVARTAFVAFVDLGRRRVIAAGTVNARSLVENESTGAAVSARGPGFRRYLSRRAIAACARFDYSTILPKLAQCTARRPRRRGHVRVFAHCA